MRSNSWQCMTMEPILILIARMNDTCCNQDWRLKESSIIRVKHRLCCPNSNRSCEKNCLQGITLLRASPRSGPQGLSLKAISH